MIICSRKFGTNIDFFFLNASLIRVIAVAGMVTLQNLQNLAMAQNLPQVASFAAGLQGMSTELTSNQLINAPLNLTVSPPGERIFILPFDNSYRA